MFDFPNSPTNGQIVTGPGGVQWSWDAVGGKWVVVSGSSPGLAPINSPVFTGDPQAPNPASADNDTSIATTSFVQSAVSASGGQHNIGRNLIHNSLFNVQQRGTGPWTADGSYTADRWQLNVTGDTASISVVQTGTPSSTYDDSLVWALQNVFTGTSGASAFTRLVQKVEKILRVTGKTVILSFYASASAPIKIGCNLYQYFGTGGTPSAGSLVQATGVAFNLTTSFQRFSATFSIPSAQGKTLGTNGDDFLEVLIGYSAGANGSPSYGNIGVQSGTVYLWGVQLEVANPGQTLPSPLEKLDPRMDLANSQRFYQTSSFRSTAYQAAGSGFETTAYFATTMRGTPSVVLSGTGVINSSAPTVVTASSYAVIVQGIATATGPTQIYGNIAATADL